MALEFTPEQKIQALEWAKEQIQEQIIKLDYSIFDGGHYDNSFKGICWFCNYYIRKTGGEPSIIIHSIHELLIHKPKKITKETVHHHWFPLSKRGDQARIKLIDKTIHTIKKQQ